MHTQFPLKKQCKFYLQFLICSLIRGFGKRARRRQRPYVIRRLEAEIRQDQCRISRWCCVRTSVLTPFRASAAGSWRNYKLTLSICLDFLVDGVLSFEKQNIEQANDCNQDQIIIWPCHCIEFLVIATDNQKGRRQRYEKADCNQGPG